MDASRRVCCDEIESSRTTRARRCERAAIVAGARTYPSLPPNPNSGWKTAPARFVRANSSFRTEQRPAGHHAAAHAHRGAHAGSRSPRHAFGAHGIMSAARMAPLSAQEEQDKWLAGARPTRAPRRRPRPHFSPGVVVAARARIRARPAHSPSLNPSPRLRSPRRRRPEPRQAVRLLHETRAGASSRDVRPFPRRRKRRHRPRVPDLTT